jgi:hypothetical protein
MTSMGVVLLLILSLFVSIAGARAMLGLLVLMIGPRSSQALGARSQARITSPDAETFTPSFPVSAGAA